VNPLRAIVAIALVLSLTVVVVSAASLRPASAAPLAGLAAAPASEGPFITATGVGVSAAPAGKELDLFAQMLFVGAETSVQAGEIGSALQDMTTKIGAIRASLVRAGVADAAIHMQNLAVYPVGVGQKPGTTPAQPITTYTIMANLQVDVPTVRSLIAAMEAARAAGATQVSTAGKGGAGGPQNLQPAQAELDAATAAAMTNARSNAEAIAKASGKKLGALHSISALQPSPDCCPPGTGWRVQLTVTYEIAP